MAVNIEKCIILFFLRFVPFLFAQYVNLYVIAAKYHYFANYVFFFRRGEGHRELVCLRYFFIRISNVLLQTFLFYSSALRGDV